MFGERQTRQLLGPADPASGVPVPQPRHSAVRLIERAETVAVAAPPGTRPPGTRADGTRADGTRADGTRANGTRADGTRADGTGRTGGDGRHLAGPSRRLVLAGATAILVGGAVSAVVGLRRDADPGGPPPDRADSATVLVPMAYQIATNPPPAGDYLRALAGRITESGYDTRAGRYAYHKSKSWGASSQTSREGYEMSYVEQREVWAAADGSGRIQTTQLAPEFPDEASRRYWQRALAHRPDAGRTHAPGQPYDSVGPGQAGPTRPLPTDPTELARELHTTAGIGAVTDAVGHKYEYYLILRPSRAGILEVLAGVPGFVWRGEVTDRAGRPGVAVTVDDREHDEQSILVFDPRTGELLAREVVSLSRHRVMLYTLFVKYDLTDRLG